MRYLCTKQLTVGGVTYYPGATIPDGAILPERSGKLLKSGYISELDGKTEETADYEPTMLFTKEQVDRMVAEAVAEAEKKEEDHLAELRECVAELGEAAPGAYDGTVMIAVRGESDEQFLSVSAKPEEIQQAFSIMQMNAEEGAKAITAVESENVLILLHAADSRKTVRNAAKEQADKLFSHGEDSNDASNGSEATDTNMMGADI